MMSNNEYKVLKFDSKFRQKIIKGEKNCTIRFDDVARINEGDKVVLKDSDDTIFASAGIKRKVVRGAGEIVGMRIDGHREYDSMEEFLNEMNKYYGGRISDESNLYMIWFEVENAF